MSVCTRSTGWKGQPCFIFPFPAGSLLWSQPVSYGWSELLIHVALGFPSQILCHTEKDMLMLHPALLDYPALLLFQVLKKENTRCGVTFLNTKRQERCDKKVIVVIWVTEGFGALSSVESRSSPPTPNHLSNVSHQSSEPVVGSSHVYYCLHTLYEFDRPLTTSSKAPTLCKSHGSPSRLSETILQSTILLWFAFFFFSRTHST